MKISAAELRAFAQLSLDHNPLHTSADYAHRTSFGQPVVFGVLAALKAMRELPARANSQLLRLRADFQAPVFAETEYTVSVQAGEKTQLRVSDGRRTLLVLHLEFGGEAGPLVGTAVAQASRASAASPNMELPLEVAGNYSVPAASLERFLRDQGLEGRGLHSHHLLALLWASYVVGMEIPGLNALFSSLKLEFSGGPELSGLVPYRAELRDFDPRFHRAKIHASLGNFAVAELVAYARQELPKPTHLKAPTQELAGKVALVIGASRGLGSSLAIEFARRGATVIGNFHRSGEAAKELEKTISENGGRFQAAQGDAGDETYVASLVAQVLREHGRLDFLVCNASPALLPFWLEPNTVGRVNEFVDTALRLVSVPLAYGLPELAKNGGTAAVISSHAIHTMFAEWPHYIAAKAAAEALAQVSAKQYPQAKVLVARPPYMLTDLTNSPLAGASAIDHRVVAEMVVEKMVGCAAGYSLVDL